VLNTLIHRPFLDQLKNDISTPDRVNSCPEFVITLIGVETIIMSVRSY